MARRSASHAGSWYSADPERLSLELDRWIDQVRSPASYVGPISTTEAPVELPAAGARVIIAPCVKFNSKKLA